MPVNCSLFRRKRFTDSALTRKTHLRLRACTRSRAVPTHPLIVHLGFNADPAYWIHGAMPRAARVLIDAFWPGPLTLILPRAAHIPAAVSGGQPSIGLRCPAHPLAQALLNAFHHLGKIKGTPQRGIAAPSANRFGRVSPTAAQHVRDEFGDA